MQLTQPSCASARRDAAGPRWYSRGPERQPIASSVLSCRGRPQRFLLDLQTEILGPTGNSDSESAELMQPTAREALHTWPRELCALCAREQRVAASISCKPRTARPGRPPRREICPKRPQCAAFRSSRCSCSSGCQSSAWSPFQLPLLQYERCFLSPSPSPRPRFALPVIARGRSRDSQPALARRCDRFG